MSRARVLLVDDFDVNLDILSSFISHTGRDCVCAHGGAEAVWLAGTEDFAMILMDLRMPGTDGVEAARQIRALSGTRGTVPIAALSAYGTGVDTILRCHEAGMCAVIGKPLDFVTLSAVLDRVIGPVQGPGA